MNLDRLHTVYLIIFGNDILSIHTYAVSGILWRCHMVTVPNGSYVQFEPFFSLPESSQCYWVKRKCVYDDGSAEWADILHIDHHVHMNGIHYAQLRGNTSSNFFFKIVHDVATQSIIQSGLHKINLQRWDLHEQEYVWTSSMWVVNLQIALTTPSSG